MKNCSRKKNIQELLDKENAQNNTTSGDINGQNNTTSGNNQNKYSFIEKAGIGVFIFILTTVGLVVIKKIFDYYKQNNKTNKIKQRNYKKLALI